ncbi:MAG: glutathione S-transferase family protein [Alphaproteobacteria bacterium]|jgi:GSH-dependent disulfide-bond oxidoreductase|nr:glutathione S-transferase family protein [Rhodospirillaceae bacterium]MBT6202955.1 glutathione S-transferase family protein [Rhodospirillaceae bacterium]MBT6510545.1 glutathione S-transferase family protein [Rhodospirillaceae bacterium]MBT7613512.1 glutathione S-transferase family protein [Rhodospirillaceae bacterium]MDG2483348.1 glutathione S-transferase family protein [Alphaproteobacteria bacterium]
MIDLYTSYTTNAQRASIALLESGLPYRLHHIDLYKGEHKTPEFLAINPNGTLPAMTDRDGLEGKPLTLTQSAGIAWYLAEKSGRLLPKGPRALALAQDWNLFLATDIYPPFASQYYLRWSDLPDPEPAAAMFETRMRNAFGQLDRELAERPFVCGEEITIVDINAYPMTAMATQDFAVLGDLKNLIGWRDRLAERPAVAEAMGWYADNAPALDKVPDTWAETLKG